LSITQEPPRSRILVEEGAGEAVRAVVAGEIDLANADALDEALGAALASGRDVLVDLTATEFIDSYGLAVLHRANVRAAERRLSLRLVCPTQGLVHRVLVLTQLDHLVEPPTADAVAG
jgi:anti-sigma B factor antagonist